MNYRVAILIPAYNPDQHLIQVLTELFANLSLKSLPIILVNDGSQVTNVFDEIAKRFEKERLIYLKHPTNLGKGAALKTGLSYVRQHLPQVQGVVTMDADGQHQVSDVVRCVKLFSINPRRLVLGVREFDQPNVVPWRSRFGNQLTRQLVKITTGQKFTDTQTGLRVIPQRYFATCLAIPENDYSFELLMLLKTAQAGIKVAEQPIQTVYEVGNPTSHFRPIRDSWCIYREFFKYIFGQFIKFTASSLSAAIIDLGAFIWFHYFLHQVFFAVIIARVISGTYNYFVNRQIVFATAGHHSLGKYISLAIIQGLLAAGLTQFLSYPVAEHLSLVTVIKVLVDGGLFLLSYQIQKRWVFNG